MYNIYQIHKRYQTEGHGVVHSINYEVSSPSEFKLPEVDTDNVEIYALQVSEQTIRDEIAHCEELIEYWESRPSYPKVDTIISRQKNLIKHYNTLLRNYGC